MVGSGGRPAAFDGYASADAVARSQASILFRVSRVRDTDVALKVFQLSANAEERASARTAMLGDWRIWRDLGHPHVLPVSDFGERNDALYVTTPWVDGPSLRAVLDQRRVLDPAEVRPLAEQVASALDAAAGAGLIHQDVKPSNVLFQSGDRSVHAWVTDFGAGTLAARRMGGEAARSFGGTFDYAAPEQVDGGAVDGRAMVYALGSVLYETLTGAAPYVHRSRETAPAPVAGQPAEVDHVFARALSMRRDERYATCAELAEALCDALVHSPAPQPIRLRPRRRFGLAHATALASVLLVASGAATAASWLTGGKPAQAADPVKHTAEASRDFLAALGGSHRPVKPVEKPHRAVPAAPASKVVRPEHHTVTATPAPVTTTSTTQIASRPATHQAPAVVTPRRVAAPPVTTTPETTPTPTPTSPSLPPPPPASQDPTLPPPPP